MRTKLLIALLLIGIASTSQAQTLKRNPRAWQFDCPDLTALSVPDASIIDFYLCPDTTGANCAAAPAQSSANIPVASFAQVPNTSPARCEIATSGVPYPVGNVYITKMRYTNAGGPGGPSNATDPFGKTGAPGAAPAHLQIMP